ncbi:helix-turn-helix domain-containing protein [Micromonospora sp. RTGN7]|uniref:helix-turn-helix domain-containing protein n=1 Tax=Micromonospora sp. RTGN7 TaxID=3016526 RepID=UPI0029FEDCD0|nr:helix-turn-helix domain-containing protein [Micromonospora sp. RTGN7]
MDELPIGRRVAYWRGRRKMSQQQFADAIGKSKSWVDKIERGLRSLDKLSTLEAIADALRVDLRMLLGREIDRDAGANGLLDTASGNAVRGALTRWGPVQVPGDQEVPTLATVGKAVTHAWLSYQYARYAELVRSLPRLLADAQRVRATSPCTDAAYCLAEAYQLASVVMGKVGAADLAWLAADRAMAASQDAGDQLLTGACAVQLGHALLAQGQALHAMEIGVAVAHQIAPPDPLDAPATHLSVYGTLLLAAARAAAALVDPDGAAELLGQAAEAAAIIGNGQDHYRTTFGPTVVELARIATAVELGDGGTLDPTAHQRLIEGAAFRRLPPERRAAYLLDAARGFLQASDLDRAGQAVVSADRVAAAEVRARPVGHELLATLLRRSPAPGPDVLRLAEDVGVRV